MIAAICIVSASEVALVKKDFTYEWAEENKTEFDKILWEFGLDTTQPIEIQQGLTHKNRMHQIVQCDRWVGYERTDKEWIDSGYASKEAKDKASGNKLIADIYRSRGYY